MMENIFLKSMDRRICWRFMSLRLNHTEAEPEYPTSNRNPLDKGKTPHPYRKIHPWVSKFTFAESLADNALYNKDGLVAINKPYGISSKTPTGETKRINKSPSFISNEANYTLTDALPVIAKKLGYESLTIVKAPEKFTSGVTLLAATEKVQTAINKSFRIAEGLRFIPRTFWTVTRNIPRQLEGERRVAMTLNRLEERIRPVPMIISNWSENARARGEIKILNVQFKVLSHGTHNFASLMEIKSSTTVWHAVRLFASTVLFAPVLGDRIYGSRVQEVLGKMIVVSPGVEAAHVAPKLNPNLLNILKVGKNKDTMIPAHMHLREIYLPSFLRKNNDITITAPLFPEFIWTCKQCEFDEKLFENVKQEVTAPKSLEKRSEVT